MKSQKKGVFITGIAGFIGFHIACFLIKRGDYVIGCDNFNNYYSPKLKKIRADYLRRLGIQIIAQNIQSINIHNEKITHVLHLAAQAGVRYCINHPQPYVESNLVGFLKVLELCRTIPDVKLIFASSSSVYGGNIKVPFSENDPTDSPLSLYAATKKGGELMAKSYHHFYNIPMTGLRFFTVYGPWGRPDMAYFSFAEKILCGKAISVFNYGKMKRDFTYIDDIVKGTVLAIDRCNGFEIYNLGNNKPQPLMKLIMLLETYLNKKATIDFKEMEKTDVITTFADIQKARRCLGYKPTISLEEGIKRFVNWYEKDLQRYIKNFLS